MNNENMSVALGQKFSISTESSESVKLLKKSLTQVRFLMITARQCAIIFQAKPETWQHFCWNGCPESQKIGIS